MGAAKKIVKFSKKDREERERRLVLKHKYEIRVSIAKQGKAAYDSKDYMVAISKYREYLDIMANVHNVAWLELHPDLFDPTKQLTEMLLVSHIYFELAKMYDYSEKFQAACFSCLDQFVTFSINQPYQILNSELIRKQMRRTGFKNSPQFYDAYRRIHLQSNKCFVVTHCFGEDHLVTYKFRVFKKLLQQSPFGLRLVEHYYRLSPKLIGFLQTHPNLENLFAQSARTFLRFFSRFLP